MLCGVQKFAFEALPCTTICRFFNDFPSYGLAIGLRLDMWYRYHPSCGLRCSNTLQRRMKQMKTRAFWIFLLFSIAITSASAGVVTSIPGGTVVAMPAVNYSGGGPQVFGPGITWTSTNTGNGSDSVFGFTSDYGFGLNGDWTGALGPMAGLNDSTDFFGVTDTMTFTFASPVAAVGGFLNYYPGSFNPTTIAVYDSNGNQIESYDLIFNTSGANDTGSFYGFQETSNVIKSFTLTDNYIGITNLTYASAVPEPGSLLLLGSGFMGAAGYLRKRLAK
jgi:PEP-CTERM motif-containing protein